MRVREPSFDGVFLLLIINIVLFVADKVLHLPWVPMLYLQHSSPMWFQYVTSLFCHASFQHISGNLFFLYVFGKLVEEEEGAFGVVASYLICGIGANVASMLLLHGPGLVSLGASGSVFGLFAVSVLVKLRWNLKKLVEVGILGQFVVERFLEEASASTRMGAAVAAGGGVINHVAHLAGALMGVLLIFIISRLPGKSSGDES